MKKLVSITLVAALAALFCGTVVAQERGEHRRGGERRGVDKRSEQVERYSRIRKAVSEGKMTRKEAAEKIMELSKKSRSSKDSKRGSRKPVVDGKGCKCSCHKKATKKSEKRTQERRRGRGRGRTEGRRTWGGRGRTLLYRSHRG